MQNIYEELQGVTSSLLGDFKQGVIRYIALTPGTGSADDPGPSVETPYVINAVARGVAFKYVDGANVLLSDFQLTMPADGVAPDMNGFIEMDGARYKITQIKRLPAAGVAVAWVVIFRK